MEISILITASFAPPGFLLDSRPDPDVMEHTMKWSTEFDGYQLQDKDEPVDTDYRDAQPALIGRW